MIYMGVTDDVLGRLAAGGVVIVDGGTGSPLQAEGVPMDQVAWSARANLSHPGGCSASTSSTSGPGLR